MIDKQVKNNIHLLYLKGGGVAQDILSELADYAKEHDLVKQNFTQALLEREKNYPTGLKGIKGIAIPHADQQYTKRPSIIVALMDKPVEFDGMANSGKVAVSTIFLLLLNNLKNQVLVLEEIVNFIQDRVKMEALTQNEAIITIENSFGKYLVNEKVDI